MKTQKRWIGFQSIILIVGLVVLLAVNSRISSRVQEVIQTQEEISTLIQNSREVEGTLLAVSLTVAKRGNYERTRSPQDWRRFEQAWNSSTAEIERLTGRLGLSALHGSQEEASRGLDQVLRALSQAMGSLNSPALSSTVDTLTPLYDSYRFHSSNLNRFLHETRVHLERQIQNSYLEGALSLVVAVVFFGLAYAFLQVQIYRTWSFAAHWKEETERAQKAERISAEFLANMSHEIRTPMTAILGFGELLKSVVDSPRAQTYLSGIETSGKALLTLINDILDLSKAEAGLLVLDPVVASPRQMAVELEQIFFSLARNKHLALETLVDEAVPQRCRYDEVRVRQVLINLVGNAIKYTEKGFVRVRITVSQDSQRLLFEVADSGIGIPREDWELVFRPFRQVESDKTRRFGGTGLGLSISSRLAALMGGRIDLESEPGVGSAFTFSFPLDPVATIRRPDSPPAPKRLLSLKGGTVLLVDDEPHNLTIMKEFLSGQETKVLQASDGVEAMALMAEVPIDVLVTDIQMPRMSGMELIQRVRQRKAWENLPVVVVTASTLNSDLEAELAAPRRILSKPFSRAAFVEALSEYLPHDLAPDGSTPLSPKEPPLLSDRKGLVQEVTASLYPRLREVVADSSIDGFVDFALFLEEAGHRWNESYFVASANTIRRAADDLDIAELQKGAQELSRAFESLTASATES